MQAYTEIPLLTPVDYVTDSRRKSAPRGRKQPVYFACMENKSTDCFLSHLLAMHILSYYNKSVIVVLRPHIALFPLHTIDIRLQTLPFHKQAVKNLKM